MDSANNSVNIVILDACRNYPFQRSFRSAIRGLAQMDAPSGTMFSFATAPGSVAADGENGLYTQHLLTTIGQPGLPIEQVFKQVRIGVTRDTADQQVPRESSSLKGDFFFVPGTAGGRSAARPAAQQGNQAAAVQRAVEEENAWAAKEREVFQKRMEAMIATALEKQRAELDAARRERGDGASGYGCEIEVEIEGRETVSTPAGTFDAIRVDMVIYFDGVYGRPNGRLSLSCWYAPAARRLVRATGRDSGSLHYGFDDFEIVLLAYQLTGEPPVGRSEVLNPAISGR